METHGEVMKNKVTIIDKFKAIIMILNNKILHLIMLKKYSGNFAFKLVVTNYMNM